MTVKVGPGGDYHTISEAVEAVPFRGSHTIEIRSGIYREKLFIDKEDITLRGEGMGHTVIEYGDGAFDVMPDGTKRGTFRSQTLFLGGGRAHVTDMTIRNTAGPGDAVGQALAVYADSSEVFMERVEISAHQDTLFLAPLPIAERSPGGFFGPRYLSERRPTVQHYKGCVIRGDVDFIFGGADATFEECEIIVCDRNRAINGYVCAPSEPLGGVGFEFKDCVIRGEHEGMKGTVFLARPWRPAGTVSFTDCRFDDCIDPRRFSGWKDTDSIEPEARFSETGSMDLSGRKLSCS